MHAQQASRTRLYKSIFLNSWRARPNEKKRVPKSRRIIDEGIDVWVPWYLWVHSRQESMNSSAQVGPLLSPTAFICRLSCCKNREIVRHFDDGSGLPSLYFSFSSLHPWTTTPPASIEPRTGPCALFSAYTKPYGHFGAAFSTEIEHLPRAASRARTVAGGGDFFRGLYRNLFKMSWRGVWATEIAYNKKY